MRRVFTSMAGRRLLPKEGWSLNRVIHDTAAPTVKARVEADTVLFAIQHRLLEDTSRRFILDLIMEGDFTRIQERPLSLPPSLVRLELNGFRGLRELELLEFPQLDEVPPGLRVLKLHTYEHPLPPLPDTLETLVLDNCTHHVVDVPDSVRSLSLYWRPPEPAPPLPARWPPHLERLAYWARCEDAALELNGCVVHTCLPQNLREMRLGSEFTQRLTFTGRVTLMNSKSAAVDNSKRRKTPAPVTPGVADGNISGFRHAADSSPDLELERRLRETEKEFNEVLRRSAELEKCITQGVPPPEVPQLLARLATLIAALDKLQAERVDAIVPQTGRHSEGVSETARKRRRSMNATLQERRAWLEQALDAARAYAKAGAAV
ncbi:hypothetical protein JKP88DRAFT_349276 [Tribonema minus]|uniref:Uncharacterized protein n=1 Tax=Tribonema minus TaxID=303371 RepID=A0A835YTI8_9STRA|nr:hypothetical protein JKP88DRAFT_349276 [Tribonema minus]